MKNKKIWSFLFFLLLSCNENKTSTKEVKQVEKVYQKPDNGIYANLKITKTKHRVDFVYEYWNVLKDSLLIDNPKDERDLIAMLYFSKKPVQFDEFEEEKIDTVIRREMDNVRDTVRLHFNIKREYIKSKCNLNFKIIDAIHLYSYHETKIRLLEFPFYTTTNFKNCDEKFQE